jgi:hypothetical protein
MGLVPHKAIRRTQEIVDIMDRTSVEIFERKRSALQQGDEAVLQQIGHGKDIMSILCRCHFPKPLGNITAYFATVKANMAATEEDCLQEAELVGQMTCVSSPTMIISALSVCVALEH